MNWPDFFGALSETFGERAPFLVVTVLGLAAFVYMGHVFVRALGRLTGPLAETQKSLQKSQAVLEEIPRQMQEQRTEFRSSAEAHRTELRTLNAAASETVGSLRTIHDELRELARTIRESDREHMRGIERIVVAIVRKARGAEPC